MMSGPMGGGMKLRPMGPLAPLSSNKGGALGSLPPLSSVP